MVVMLVLLMLVMLMKMMQGRRYDAEMVPVVMLIVMIVDEVRLAEPRIDINNDGVVSSMAFMLLDATMHFDFPITINITFHSQSSSSTNV